MFRNLIPEMKCFRNLSRTKHGENVQESIAEIAFVLNFLPQMFPAQRQDLRQNTAQIMAMPVIVRQGVHNHSKPSYTLVEQNLARFCAQKIRIPSRRRTVLQPPIAAPFEGLSH